MEIWQIIVICILLLPLFLIANYIVVKKAASARRSRGKLKARLSGRNVRQRRRSGQVRFIERAGREGLVFLVIMYGVFPKLFPESISTSLKSQCMKY